MEHALAEIHAAPQTRTELIAQKALGAMLVGAGVGHLTFLRKPFHAQVPPWLPMDPDHVVVLSGLTEIALGAALLLAKRRRVLVGWIAGAFFVLSSRATSRSGSTTAAPLASTPTQSASFACSDNRFSSHGRCGPQVRGSGPADYCNCAYKRSENQRSICLQRVLPMHPEDQLNASFAYLLLRVILGVNICVHGVSRLLAGNHAFAAGLVHSFQPTPLPGPLVYAFALVLPWSEAILGFLILVGLFRRAALLLGGAMLIALTFGSTLRQDWESAGLQLIYALVYAILLACMQYDCFAADSLLGRGRAARR